MSEVDAPLTMSINEATFTEIYNSCWEKVFAICYNHIDDVEVAKELVQEIFKSLWERRESLQITISVERYLLRAAKLKVFEYIRNKQLRAEHLRQVAKCTSAESNVTEDTIMHRALSETVEHLVKKLPIHCQRIFRMSYEKGMSNKEIAHQLVLSERTVAYHLANALKQLKNKLGTYTSSAT